MNTHSIAAPALLLVALSACKGDDGSRGGLGNGSFTYVCVGSEWRCRFDAPLPAAYDGPMHSEVLAGSTFGFTYAPDDPSQEVTFELVPSSRASLVQDASGLVTVTSHGAGYVSVLGQAPGGVIDVHSFEFRSATDLRIAGYDAQGSEFFTGERVAGATLTVDFNDIPAALEVTPVVKDGGLALPGSLNWTWTTTDEQVVRFAGPTNTARVDIEANTGSATLTVGHGQLTTTLEVTIP